MMQQYSSTLGGVFGVRPNFGLARRIRAFLKWSNLRSVKSIFYIYARKKLLYFFYTKFKLLE